eukprot:CAMPEP_0116868908 /NCGR_PEP_ID=MMETSP0418-20121206/27465_1 /TAXON_ID=1158023 /ORGANISM="Astrosyne radiata, Strain 13vi08-1A" /LENGTH=64 /DNA_ID=CAMNT_0004504945 /DNA_START=10 /DNA_END=201 /DNA_ORIENTATION=+
MPNDDEDVGYNNLLACPLYKLHGNVPHADRQRILGDFNNNKTSSSSVLLATDVAARGLNLSRVD